MSFITDRQIYKEHSVLNQNEAIVFDTETTGIKEPIRIVEAAYLRINDMWAWSDRFVQRYNPGIPIETGALATHHILDREVATCPPCYEFQIPADIEYVIGHNVDFDMKAIGDPKQYKRICTLAIARKYLPDTSHQQNALMYYFFGEAAREATKDAHSAMVDVLNCFEVLKQLVAIIEMSGTSINSFQDLYEESERCRIPDVIKFGKHEGMRVEDLPRDYTSWLLKQDWLDPYLRIAVMKAREK